MYTTLTTARAPVADLNNSFRGPEQNPSVQNSPTTTFVVDFSRQSAPTVLDLRDRAEVTRNHRLEEQLDDSHEIVSWYAGRRAA